MTTQQECSGCVGRGTGSSCCMCSQPVPENLRRTATSPSEVQADCADCQRGRVHSH